MTTENVTVLFTDMVGSTALASGLAPDDADELRRAHFSILRQAVAEASGTEVKTLGDGLMVVFATASAALSCAVGMQRGIERDNRAHDRKVGLRVGLSAGEVTREGDDYFGDPCVEAARLCASCEGAQILAADVVRAMAGRRNRHACRPIGELALKGLPDPIATVEVGWEPLDPADEGMVIPLPGRVSVRPPVGVVGREAETVRVLRAFERVAAGAGREVLLVAGEAGVGKTTLVVETARAAFDGDACVLFGHCEEDLATPYQLFAEALGHYVAHAPEAQLVAHVAEHGSELARLVPALASRLRDLPATKATDTDTERFLLFAAVVGIFSMASQHQPVVLVLDDLQWADKASLLLLRHLLASEHAMRVLILGTYRDSELSRSHPFLDTLAALRRQHGVSRIELAGLDDAGVMALVEATVGRSLDAAAVDLARALYRETDGNPFFMSEVLAHLAETGAITQDTGGRWATIESIEQIALPDSVREVIGARVGRLGKEAERVLSVAAVIGRDFDLDVLALATNTLHDDLLDILEAAAAVALVREMADAQGRYNFAHALIQHTLYEDLGPSRRARTHQRVAVALEELCGDRPGERVGELARHWYNAQPFDSAKAISYARQAGDAALGALAPADALRYYGQALGLCARGGDIDPTVELALAIGLGTAERQTGDPAYRERLLAAARRAADLDDTDHLVAAALANNRGWFSDSLGVDTDRVEVLEMAAARLPAERPERALVLATLCAELTHAGTLERRESLADEALAIAELSGDDAIIVRVLNHVSEPLAAPSLLEQSLARTADALARAERIGDPLLLFMATQWRAETAARAGDIDEVDRCIEVAGPLAEQLDQAALTWILTFRRAMRAQIAGDTDQAERFADEAFRIGKAAGQSDADTFYGGQWLMVMFQRGSLGELASVLEPGAADTDHFALVVKALLALAYAEADRADDARRLLESITDPAFARPFTGAGSIVSAVDYAEAAIACGDPGFAGPLFDLLLPWSDRLATDGGLGARGPVSHFLGALATVLGRYDEADEYFAQAAAFNERVSATFFAARTNLSWGKMLAERGAPGGAEKARELLTAAHVAAAAFGYANVERRAAAALQHLD